MVVAVDTVGDGDSGNQNSFSFSHTITGTDRAALVIVGTGGATASSVTVGSTTCSLLIAEDEGGEHIEIWFTDSEPASGAQTVSGNLSSMQQSAINSISLTDVDPDIPAVNPTIGSFGFPAVVNQHDEVDNIAIGAYRGDEDPTAGGDATKEWSANAAGNHTAIFSADATDQWANIQASGGFTNVIVGCDVQIVGGIPGPYSRHRARESILSQ